MAAPLKGKCVAGNAQPIPVVGGGFRATGAATLVIIDNDGADSVTGAFTGLAEGATVALGDLVYTISYCGGDGNDVTLTLAAPQ